MGALNDRRMWLAHLRDCTRCPVDLCDQGLELAAAVRATLAKGEYWEGVWVKLEGRWAPNSVSR